MPGPLEHITVLDLSRVMAGPWAGQILADLGAKVIKVERPHEGDDTRAWGPPFLAGDEGPGGTSGYFLSVNRGKRSVTADIASAEGQAFIRGLAADADIVLENFKVGTLARYGLDHASLSAINPRLIYASITGFGQDGPRATQPAYDFIIQAMSGLMSITGRADDEPGGGPQKVGVPIIDIMTGMYAAIGVLAALERRRETGRGDHIDLAMLDVGAAFLANQAMNHLLTGAVPRRTGNRHPNIQPQNVYPCREGHLALAVGNDRQFVKLTEALGCAHLGGDPRFATNAARVRNLTELEPLLIDAFAARSAEDWQEALDTAGVPASRINSVADVFAEPQVRHRAMVRQLPHGSGAQVPSVVSPLRFAGAPLAYRNAAPRLGEDDQDLAG
ncbi:CoA transferase [Sphingomonas gilva]|uniref:CoA transferase n=1 Tax=Sphingomonas gilva TaxID=2305907 RepID=A0A396RXP4_9SPHN|nr:CoA transferase [Sphingomonas gilva]RHW19243.1 CoA transferase [Sphingomonas gilva]